VITLALTVDQRHEPNYKEMSDNSKPHWERIYSTKRSNELSWTQERPETSLDIIRGLNLPKSAKIIDIGGGDSRLVDYLLVEGFQDITVLDISGSALRRAKKRLGNKGASVKWIVSDVTKFETREKYDIWHDRATFHFLTTNSQISSYLDTARKVVSEFLAIATFSHNGPKTCSGLNIKQYTESELETQLSVGFKKIRCISEDHVTPFNTTQNFLFCSFRKNVLN
jgi:hypothetical protein